MAIVSQVITPYFFSEDEPYMIVQFIEEFENKFRTAACTNPRYLVIYDIGKIYPKLNIYEAKKCFKEEMSVGHREDINLHTFSISDLTNGEYSYISFSSYGMDEFFRIAIYDNFDEWKTAKQVLNILNRHQFIKLS